MGSITTAFCTSAKSEFMAAGHCFLAAAAPTGNTTSTSFNVASVSSMAGVCQGMSVTGTGIPASTYVAAITSGTALVLSQAATATNSGTTLTIGGDVFYIALIAASPTGVYGAATVNYTDLTGNSDEVSGAGYTAGGAALVNVSPTTSGTTAFINWSPNPSFTSATFTTGGAIIYNSSARLGGTSGTNATGAGRAVGVWSFGGSQSVSAGTLTILMPVAASSTAIVRLA